MSFPNSLEQEINKRKLSGLFRKLEPNEALIDFYSNDYLGFSKNPKIIERAQSLIKDVYLNGSGGSRLISGNYDLISYAEKIIASKHNTESALIFNSGYDANIGLISSIGLKGNILLYDELSHASIRDGIQLGYAEAFKFRHNDLNHLKDLILRTQGKGDVFVITESVFSMDGDQCPLKEMYELCYNHGVNLIVDEAHAIGVIGDKGEGLWQTQFKSEQAFARVITYGKAFGIHGASIVGTAQLSAYLVNKARSFIYTTALPPHTIASLLAAYEELESTQEIHKLKNNINHYNQLTSTAKNKINSESAIQCVKVNGNKEVDAAAELLKKSGFNVKSVKSPTVKKNEERLRICLHSFNNLNDTQSLVDNLIKEGILLI